MSTHPTQLIVQQLLQSLAQRNLMELTRLFAEAVDWYIPGDEESAPWLGRRNSRQQVEDFYTTLWKHTEPVSATIDRIFIENAHAAITGEFTTRMLPTNKMVDSLFCIQLSIANGLIVRYRLLEDSYAVSVAMHGNEQPRT